MSTLGKRSRSKTSNVSPPPLRRRTLISQPTNASLPTPSSPPDAPNLLRIFSWNVNGVSPFLQQTPITTFFHPTLQSTTTSNTTTPPYTLRAFLHRHHYPQILCLQEVKIALTDHRTQRALETSANRPSSKDDRGPQYNVHFSLPTDKHNARGPNRNGAIYGVATLIRNEFLASSPSSPSSSSSSSTGAISTRPLLWDHEGRVLLTLLPAPAHFALLNVYFVNGTANPHRDSATGAVVGTRHEWKRAFQGLVRDECLKLAVEGWRVCVVGDVNVARGEIDGWPGIRKGVEHVKSRREFEEGFFGARNAGDVNGEGDVDGKGVFEGVDVWRHLYRERRAYTYHPRGVEWGSSCDRVDLCIISRECKDTVVDMGVLETRDERGHSDHVPLWVAFELGKLR